MRVIITKKNLIEYLRDKGHTIDPDTNISFSVLGYPNNDKTNISIGDGAHQDDARPIVVDWPQPEDG